MKSEATSYPSGYTQRRHHQHRHRHMHMTKHRRMRHRHRNGQPVDSVVQ